MSFQALEVGREGAIWSVDNSVTDVLLEILEDALVSSVDFNFNSRAISFYLRLNFKESSHLAPRSSVELLGGE